MFHFYVIFSFVYFLALVIMLILAFILVFTSDGVVVGVVIRRVERYDLVKIKPTESEAEHLFCLCLRCLR